MTLKIPSMHVFFGGLFDPPHMGHLQCVMKVIEAIPEATIIVSPTPRSTEAHKIRDHETHYDHRIAMCNIQFNHLPRVRVDRFESFLPPPHYTFKSLQYLKDTGHEKLGILLGEDQFWNLPRWRHPERIIKLAQIIVLARMSDLEASNQNIIHTLNNGTACSYLEKILLNANPEMGSNPSGLKPPLLLDEDPHRASSSLLRAEFSVNPESELIGAWIVPEVLNYIKQHQLYKDP